MNEPEETPKPKRHYIPVLPHPTPETLQRAKAATQRSKRNRLIGRKLDEVLGAVDADD